MGNNPPTALNIAINAQQAKNVFFKGFKTKIERSPWFAGKYYAKAESIEFDKSITVYSGHSERESHEGLNLMMAVLDEISGFATEIGTGNDQGKTADNIYKAFRASVDSRFPDLGKVALLSFPRYPNDFISKKIGGIPVVIHEQTGTYIAETVFSNLRAGSNFNDDEDQSLIGTNGVGSTLTNVLSTNFKI
mgnify:CR=1 FL=1